MFARVVAFAFACLANMPAGAADVVTAYEFPHEPARGRLGLDVRGDILPGDTAKARRIIDGARRDGRRLSSVQIDSPGGSVSEGIELGRLIRDNRLVSIVQDNGTCASACFLALAAGQGKIIGRGARVGVHGASVDGVETPEAAKATIAMAREVARMGVPPAIIGRMAVTPASEMVWLSADELMSMQGAFGHVFVEDMAGR